MSQILSEHVELAKDFLEKRALSTLNKNVKSMIDEGNIYSIIPTSEVSSVLQMVLDGTFATFCEERKEYDL